VSKNGLFEPFIYKNEHFTKTGSGQTWGKLKKEWRFLREFQSGVADAGTVLMHDAIVDAYADS
jgi:hypothetical protein